MDPAPTPLRLSLRPERKPAAPFDLIRILFARTVACSARPVSTPVLGVSVGSSPACRRSEDASVCIKLCPDVLEHASSLDVFCVWVGLWGLGQFWAGDR